MLVLSRKKNQVIALSGGIRVMVCEIRGDQVRIGIEAPADVKIWRAEIGEGAELPPLEPPPGAAGAAA